MHEGLVTKENSVFGIVRLNCKISEACRNCLIDQMPRVYGGYQISQFRTLRRVELLGCVNPSVDEKSFQKNHHKSVV